MFDWFMVNVTASEIKYLFGQDVVNSYKNIKDATKTLQIVKVRQ